MVGKDGINAGPSSLEMSKLINCSADVFGTRTAALGGDDSLRKM